MCHFVTAVLPKSAPHADLDAIARGHGRQFLSISNPSIEAVIGMDEACFLTTLGHCDCGTLLGASLRKSAKGIDWVVEEHKLIRKGWSKGKIERALAQKREHSETDVAALEASEAMASWVAFVSAVLDSGKTPHLGLLLHMYSGPLDEQIELAGTEQKRRDEVRPDLLGHMREDVLYLFQR